MEILARILAEKASSPLFKFHWRCEKTKIVNLCFADDLMIFSRGDPHTVNLIMQGLEEFRSLSGLTPSPSKSNIYLSRCNLELKEAILHIINFTKGSLPVKYLGVPLITTKLKVIHDIESLLRSFLWSGTELKKHSAKIAWKNICKHKNEGGLGFKDMEDKGPKVPWSKLIWGPPLIPRVSFVVWLANNERLNTGDRLQMFGLVPNPSFHFCQAPESNHTHLFFRCAYSSRIWAAVQTKCNTSCPNLSWVETVDYATKTLKGKTLQSVIMKLSSLCTAYHIWMERNSRIFRKVSKPEEIVTNSIIQMVRGRLLSMENVTNSAANLDWSCGGLSDVSLDILYIKCGLREVKEVITYSFSLWVLCEDVSSGSSEFRYSSITLYWAGISDHGMVEWR
ncbi:uncharacterized protein LOC114287814 [Camellia sinensis]|uniref:uncharacterized protein LOC114287814 n=1 Tax=Camellia sinensis TaxID=4442 RepID=UPI001036B8C9|nr:uncharacterized protein LOC114287814 [Camellia sinensis]